MPARFRFSRSLARGAAALVTIAAAALPAGAQRTFTGLTMFGDSFSDVGNARALFGPTTPARFSNGDVWSDYLGRAIGRSGDVVAAYPLGAPERGVYAVGGARTTGTLPPGTAAQIARWCVANPQTGSCTRAADPGHLYTLFIGGNDVRTAAQLGTDAQRRAAVVAAANATADQGGIILGNGARNLLLGYLPDLGRVPDTVNGPNSALLTELTDLFNQTLGDRVHQLRANNIGANVFDLRIDYLFQNLLADPGRYGFTNTTGNCAADGRLPTCAGYVFADNLHPTTAAHALVGAAAYQLVAFDRNVQQVVPEPATIALLAGGLAVLGGVAARRRRERAAA